MFRKFTTILNQAVEALAPSTPLQEDFMYHWKAITNYFLDNKDDKRPIEQTNIPEHLEQMITILIEEERIGETGSTGPCMEYMLHHKLLDTLYTLGRTDCPPGMKQQVLLFFTKLLSRISQPLLPHVNVHKAVQRLIKVCGEVKAAPTEAEEIQFLLTVCSKLRQDPYLVNFFLDSGKSSSSNQTKTSSSSVEKRFVLLDSLLSLCHSADGRVGVKACEGLMLCASLPEESSADAILNRTAFCKEITNWLNMAFDRLPKTMDPSDVECVEAKWGLDVVTAQEDRTSFPGRRQLVSFISLLDFCDQLIHVSHAHVAKTLACCIREKFLSTVVQPSLFNTAEGISITATAYLIRCLRVISSCALVHEFEVFIVGDVKHSETPGGQDPLVRRLLLERCNHLSEELSAITLKLFDTLLLVPSENVIYSLVLQNLQSRSYYNHSEDLVSGGDIQSLYTINSQGDGTQGTQPVNSQSDGTHHGTQLVNSQGDGTLQRTQPVNCTEQSEINTEAVSETGDNTRTRDVTSEQTQDVTSEQTRELGDITDVHTGSGDSGEVLNKSNGANVSSSENVKCDGGEPTENRRRRYSSTHSEPYSPGFDSEIYGPISPVNTQKPNVHRIVNYFLNLVPEDAKSSYQMADSGYDTYLRDAHRQFSEVSSYCRPWHWPNEVETASSESSFYEGDFLKMIFDKMAHMLDQNYEVNLQVTSLISKLALLPHPIIHEYLLNPFVPLRPGCRSLFTVLEKLERDLLLRLKGDPNMNRRLVTVRKQLMGVLKDQRRFDDSHTLEGIIVLEEFCKELAAIAFVKHHAIDTL